MTVWFRENVRKQKRLVAGRTGRQKWEIRSKGLFEQPCGRPKRTLTLKYDALLANRRTLDDPEIVSVHAGESVLLRLVAASSSQNFYVDTGGLEAELLAVDGKAVPPIRGNFFQLAVAQRLDLKVIIPKEGGAYPILAQGEGTKLLCESAGTKGASDPKLSLTTSTSTAALDNTQEKRLRAVNPLPDHPIDPCCLQGLAETWRPMSGRSTRLPIQNRKSLDIRR